ncbi:hypothetical protein LCGC14_2031440 [marine sediment metagenome]|uniref:Uncharacterized protein n=1 Tax=marine sediment metagenome TaxID=412755 RepID=A0A0F9EUU1_9ZZZZ
MGGEGVHNPADLSGLEAGQTAILAAIADIDADLEIVDANVDSIQAIAEAEAILEEAGGELTTDGTEQTLYINNAPAGNYEPKTLIIDFANSTVTETIRILVNYRIAPAGPWVIDDRETIVGVPVNVGIRINLHEARYGIWITIEKTVGTNRAYDWQVFYEV